MEARLAAADTEYGALEAMAFEAEGVRSQIRDQARLASAFRGGGFTLKMILRDASTKQAINATTEQKRTNRPGGMLRLCKSLSSLRHQDHRASGADQQNAS